MVYHRSLSDGDSLRGSHKDAHDHEASSKSPDVHNRLQVKTSDLTMKHSKEVKATRQTYSASCAPPHLSPRQLNLIAV